MGTRIAVTIVTALAVVGASAATAFAQDYNVTNATGLYENPPASASTIFTTQDDAASTQQIPFPFVYFGQTYSTCSVCTNQFIQLGTQVQTTWSNTAINALASNSDGMIAPYWEDTFPAAGTGAVKTWVSGVAPNRKFVIAWENYRHFYESSATQYFTLQVQLFEANGRIVFAYKPGGTWPTSTNSSYTLGIDAVNPDSRYVVPSNVSINPASNTGGAPPSDYIFDPRITTFTGRVSYDRLVVNSTGIGTAIEQNLPLAGLKVELRGPGGGAVGSGFADVNGFFVVQGSALVGAQSGSLVATAQSPGCVVRATAGGLPLGFTLASSVSFATDLDVGAATINAGNDPGGTAREALNIARSIQSAHTWAAARTTDPIAQLEVLYSQSSSATTSYTKAGANPALLVVGGPSSADPDAWDVHVLRKYYARHVLGAIAAHPTTATDTAFDKATDDQNAFAEAFGYYLNAAIGLDSNFVNGTSAASASVIDLESPTLTTGKGSAVTGWLAAALYDLVDDANETWDTVDGRATVSRAFDAVNSLTVPVTAANFFQAWGAVGFDGVGLSSVFIRHGLILDDSDEPNDSATAPAFVNQFGFVRPNRVLTLYNADYYEFAMPEPTSSLTAQIVYDRLLATTFTLELQSAAGAVLATGSPVGDYGPIVAQSGALPSGTYRMVVRHTGGPAIPDYTLQAFSQMEFTSGEFAPWTVGHAYSVPVAIKGGVPPYTLTVEQPFVKPPGLVLDGANRRVYGTPTQAGSFGFVLSARDSAEPNNIASGPIQFVVNPELSLELAPYIAIAAGKAVSLKLPASGGTPPYSIAFDKGVAPTGLAAVAGELRLAGLPDTPGDFPFTITCADVATSSDSGSTTAVVCVPFGLVTLGDGAAACGCFFDAVEGSSISVAIKTAAKRAKRPLTLTLFGSDGTTTVPASTKPGTGKAALTGFVAPATGRYYLVAASTTGVATQLVTVGKLTPPKGGSGSGPDTFVAGKTHSVSFGVLAGASLTFSAKPDKSGLLLKPAYLLDPSGAVVTIAPTELKQTGGAFTVTKTLPTSGSWKFVVAAQPGPQGTFTYAFKLKQPKVSYSAD